MRSVIDGASSRRGFSPALSGLAAADVLLAIGGIAGWGTTRFVAPAAPDRDLAEYALRAHETHTPESVHPVEVSADRHDHLATWLSKRVGSRIALPDHQAHGFRLLGGRIVADEHRAAALLMYEDSGGRRMTLYISTEPDAEEKASATRRTAVWTACGGTAKASDARSSPTCLATG